MQKVKKPIFKRWWFWVIVILLLGGIGGAISGGDDDDSKDTAKTETTVESDASDDTAEAEEETQEAATEYTDIDVSTMMNDLDNNAMVATDTYKDNYYAITGKLSNIDAQGSYIDIVDPNDEWAIIGVTCYIKSDEVGEKVKTLSKGSTITVRGKITDVGEVFGYYMNIDSID